MLAASQERITLTFCLFVVDRLILSFDHGYGVRSVEIWPHFQQIRRFKENKSEGRTQLTTYWKAPPANMM